MQTSTSRPSADLLTQAQAFLDRRLEASESHVRLLAKGIRVSREPEQLTPELEAAVEWLEANPPTSC